MRVICLTGSRVPTRGVWLVESGADCCWSSIVFGRSATAASANTTNTIPHNRINSIRTHAYTLMWGRRRRNSSSSSSRRRRCCRMSSSSPPPQQPTCCTKSSWASSRNAPPFARHPPRASCAARLARGAPPPPPTPPPPQHSRYRCVHGVNYSGLGWIQTI